MMLRAAAIAMLALSIALPLTIGATSVSADCGGDCRGTAVATTSSSESGDIEAQQAGDLSSYMLSVTGLVQNETQHTLAEIYSNNSIYTRNATLRCVGGWVFNATWEGVLLSDLIGEAAPLPNASVVIFRAADGYSTSLPLSYLVNRGIILAFEANGNPIGGNPPIQLVAEGKWGYKWARWITEIELSDDTDYRGEYESFGYSNTANLNQSFVEVPGDATGDYIVDAADITKLERIIRGLDSIETVGTDANEDGSLNMTDVGVVQYKILNIWPWNRVDIKAPDNLPPNSSFTAKVYTTYVENFSAARLEINFNQSVIQVQDVTAGAIHQIDPGVAAYLHTIDVLSWNSSAPGLISIDCGIGGGANVSGSGYLAQIRFEVVGSAGQTSPIAFNVSASRLEDAAGGGINATWGNDSFTVAP